MAALSGGKTWAVGQTSSGQTLILRRTGTTWQRHPSPSPVRGSALQGAAVVSGKAVSIRKL